jgi:hypothetical protein
MDKIRALFDMPNPLDMKSYFKTCREEISTLCFQTIHTKDHQMLKMLA